MARPGIHVEGLTLLAANLRRVRGGYQTALRLIHGRSAHPIVTSAKGKARRRTGRMASTIRSSTPTPTGVEVTAGGHVYIPVQHWGWPAHGISPNLFLTDALEELETPLVADYERDLDRWVETVWVDS